MKSSGVAAIYLGFFALIACAVWWTKSGNCLWALLLAPSFSQTNDTDEEEES